MEISLAAETVFHIGSFPVTNSVLTAWVVIAILVLCGLIGRRVRLVPKGMQNVIEILVLFLYDLAASVIQNDKVTRRVFPLLGVFFIYILLGSWAGLVPGVGSIGFHEMKAGVDTFVPLFRAPMTDLNATIAMALISMATTTWLGVAVLGPIEYAKKYIRLTSPIDFVVGILEILSETARVISFSFRLFGNIFAGEVLIAVMTFIFPYVLPMPFYAMEVVVGIIQAFIFTALSIAFISLAIAKHEHPEEHKEESHMDVASPIVTTS